MSNPLFRLGPLVLALLVWPCGARAEITLNNTFSAESDLRLVVDHDRGATPGQPFHFNWNRNSLDFKSEAYINDDVRGVGHVRFLFFGLHRIAKMNDLLRREQMDPFRVDSDAAFLEVKGFLLDALNVKIGRMIHTWGTADNFSPTDNLNARDFEDPLRFGGKLANQMVVATYYLPWLQANVQAVWIPMFRPTSLPGSATLGMAADNVSQMPVRDPVHKQGLTDDYYKKKPYFVFPDPDVTVNLPPTDLDNMSGGVRAKLRLGDYDLGFSYFYGRHTFPVPKRIYAYAGDDVVVDGKTMTEQRQTVDLIYPRIQAIGFDFTSSLPWLFDLGFWIDAAALHPERVDMLMYTTNYVPGEACSPAGLAPGGLVCSRNSDPWYFKLTAGFDYTFTSWLYMNVQYLHGFDDEFGYEGVITDYVAGGVDLKFFNDMLLLRLFTLVNVKDVKDPSANSAILFPQLVLTRWDSTELQLGAIFNLGDEDTRFGNKASGRNLVFTKVKLTY
jgi:hypothetical protein